MLDCSVVVVVLCVVLVSFALCLCARFVWWMVDAVGECLCLRFALCV